MATTVRNLMFTYSRPPMDIDNDRTTSRKPWTEVYAPFHQQYVRIWQPQIQAIERFLGPGNSLSDADFIGLDTPAYPLNIFPQLVSSEGDVTRDFDQSIIPPVALAYSGNSALSIPRSDPREAVPGGPALWSRSLVGSTTSKVVDYQFTMSHSIPSLERAAAIGEMKKPRVIQRSEWLFEDNVGGVTARLQQELRGYAHVYDCPQVFLFDSNTLVIVQFQASSIDDIEREDCPIDICVIPREQDPYMVNQCTIQYALYWLIWRGWVRLCATLDHKEISMETRSGRAARKSVRAKKDLSLRGLTRSYIYWSGDPFWRDSQRRRHSIHSFGYRREFYFRQRQRRNGTIEVQGFWAWIAGDTIVEDTLNCFVSSYSALLG